MRIDPELLRRCWFLAGPTACGKSEVGLELAEWIEGEIVAMDSMSLYREMDIGTAKPPPAAQRRVPHHLLDILEPHEEFSLAAYVSAADAACRNIIARGRTPLFVGGTGLYLRGLLRGVFEGPPADWTLRRRWQSAAEREPPGWLHAQLAQVDPRTAARLHPNDAKRLVRALEVHALTGRPLSDWQREEPLPPEQRPAHIQWLRPPRDWLAARIESRVDEMFAAGLVEEVRRLWQRPAGSLGRTARQALGYKEIVAALETGADLEAAREQIKTRTRRFAKRQHTWFRNLEECTPIDITGEETPADVADRLAAGKAERTPSSPS